MSNSDQNGANGTGNGEDAYEVGYGKPPKHGQFKKGNKAGKGRPKASRNIKTLVNKAANEKWPVRKNGKVIKVRKGELVIDQVFNKAAAGDPKFIPTAIQLQERYGPPEDEPADTPARHDPDIAVIRSYLAWHDQLYGEDECE